MYALKIDRMVFRVALVLMLVLGTVWPTFLVTLRAQEGASGQEVLRDLDSHCPFVPPGTLEQWQARAADLKLQLQVSLGLFPAPVLDPVAPQIYGKVERDDYTIEKVTFESLPGFLVTGNLYRPKQLKAEQRVPGVLCPHGHWSDARFYHASEGEVKQLLATGAERFEAAAKNHIQARCVQLARMGCVVFHWDMIGYSDSQQISGQRAHRFGIEDKRADTTDKGWLLFSPKAVSNAQSILGLQALATQRAVDMLLTLPEVDSQRIAITGASGGGTQSFLGAALDERIQVAFPAVMVSTGMQGGCTCENAALLRVGTGNVEIAALIAPRPMGLTAANDWTRNMAQDGFPQLQDLYQLFDAKPQVALFPATHFPHNYNHVSRVSMYNWVNQYFHLGFSAPVLEQDFHLAGKDELSVWDAEHPLPESGLEFERKLMRLWSEIHSLQMMGLLEGDLQQRAELQGILTQGWRACLGLTAVQFDLQDIGDTVDETGAYRLKLSGSLSRGGIADWRLRQPPSKSEADNSNFGKLTSETQHFHRLQDVWLPSKRDLHIRMTDNRGNSFELFPELAGELSTEKLDGEGEYVLLRTVKQPLVRNNRLTAGYTYGYNLPMFAQQAHQLGLSLLWLKREFPEHSLTLVGKGRDAALAAAGVFCAQQIGGPESLRLALEIEPNEFAFGKVSDLRDPSFLPASEKYLDLPGLLASLVHVDTKIGGQNSQRFEKLRSIAADN